MKRKFLYSLIIIVLLIGGYLIYRQGSFSFKNTDGNNIPEGVNVGQRAPDFTLAKINGEKITLSELRGKKVFLNFWATWCSPCRIEMPDIQRLYENHKNIEILAVNSREGKSTVGEFLMLNGYNFHVVLDKRGDISTKYKIRAIPTTYILDEKGIISRKHSGLLNYEQMLELMGLG